MRDSRAPTQAGASRTPEGAEEDKGKEGRGGRSGTCRFKGAEGRSGVGGCARYKAPRRPPGSRVRRAFVLGPHPSKTSQSVSEKWGLRAILGTRALRSRRGLAPHPLRADRWLVCASPPGPQDFLRKQGLDCVASARRCASGRTEGDLPLCPVLPERCRRALRCSRPGPGRAGSARNEERQPTGPRCESRGPGLRCSRPRVPRLRGLLLAPHLRTGRRSGPRAVSDQRKQSGREPLAAADKNRR